MAAKRIWAAVVVLALAAMNSGCCKWAENWCPHSPPPCQPQCQPYCQPAPQCCPTGPAPVPVAPQGWRQYSSPTYPPPCGCN